MLEVDWREGGRTRIRTLAGGCSDSLDESRHGLQEGVASGSWLEVVFWKPKVDLIRLANGLGK